MRRILNSGVSCINTENDRGIFYQFVTTNIPSLKFISIIIKPFCGKILLEVSVWTKNLIEKAIFY